MARVGFWGGAKHRTAEDVEGVLPMWRDGYELRKVNLAFPEGLASADYYGVEGMAAQEDRRELTAWLAAEKLHGRVITHAEATAANLQWLAKLGTRN